MEFRKFIRVQDDNYRTIDIKWDLKSDYITIEQRKVIIKFGKDSVGFLVYIFVQILDKFKKRETKHKSKCRAFQVLDSEDKECCKKITFIWRVIEEDVSMFQDDYNNIIIDNEIDKSKTINFKRDNIEAFLEGLNEMDRYI